MELDLDYIKEATGASVRGGGEASGKLVSGVSTDTRTIEPGAVFFALEGPSFDGAAFVAEAAAKGAAAAVVSRTSAIEGDLSLTVLEVDDTVAALGRLAERVRKDSGVKVVAISGSSGKTTTKEMAAAIISRSRKVLKTEGNFNNHIGLPLTLLRLRGGEDVAVVELGISGAGEMDRLVEIARPEVAVLTNIGRAHLEGLGTRAGVAKAKGPLFTALAEGGVKAVNMDDQEIVKLAMASPGGISGSLTFSAAGDADVAVVEFTQDPDLSGSTAVYDVGGEKITVRFTTAGSSNAINGAAAIAASLPLDPSMDDVVEGLAGFHPVKGRLEITRVAGITIIDDTYNANPDSVASALATLACAGGSSARKVVVLGDMLELGTDTGFAHKEAGMAAAAIKASVVVAVGANAEYTASGAMEGGVGAGGIYCFKTRRDALAALKEIVREGDAVLVKGSRGAALEEVVEGLKCPAGLRGG